MFSHLRESKEKKWHEVLIMQIEAFKIPVKIRLQRNYFTKLHNKIIIIYDISLMIIRWVINQELYWSWQKLLSKVISDLILYDLGIFHLDKDHQKSKERKSLVSRHNFKSPIGISSNTSMDIFWSHYVQYQVSTSSSAS